jgi:hypothetical protein
VCSEISSCDDYEVFLDKISMQGGVPTHFKEDDVPLSPGMHDGNEETNAAGACDNGEEVDVVGPGEANEESDGEAAPSRMGMRMASNKCSLSGKSTKATKVALTCAEGTDM